MHSESKARVGYARSHFFDRWIERQLPAAPFFDCALPTHMRADDVSLSERFEKMLKKGVDQRIRLGCRRVPFPSTHSNPACVSK